MQGIKYIIWFFLILALQIFVFNHIFFLGYMNPYVYIIYLLFLPVRLSRTALLFIAFLLGLGMDIFENSGGVHAAASVMLAYSRTSILKIVSRRQESDLEDMKIRNFTFLSMFIYALFTALLHHFVLFLLESFRLADFGVILLRTFSSTIFTLIFVLIVQLWNYRRRSI